MQAMVTNTQGRVVTRFPVLTHVESGRPHDGVDLDETRLAVRAAQLQTGAGDGAQRLRDELDIVARDGGEEFVAAEKPASEGNERHNGKES